MIAMEVADVSFQLLIQIRNKIVAAYQEIMRMQILLGVEKESSRWQ